MTLRAIILLVLAAVALSGVENRDIITLKDGKQKWAYIDLELADKLMIRDAASQKEAKPLSLRDVKSWEYLEMRGDSFWAQAMESLNAGNYAVAADQFNAVATTGTRQWQTVRGAFEEGNCWDLLGEYAKAGEAFGRAASVPLHRLNLDAQYRQGFALARAKQDAEAAKVAEALAELGKKERIVAADYRAYAIRAALAFNEGKGPELKSNGKQAGFTMRDSPAAYIHFGTFFADALLSLKMNREAEIEYKRLLGTPELNPAEKVPLQLGYAKALIDSDKPTALVELLRIDALPYGSIDTKCEVRYLAGMLLAAEIKAKRASPPADQAAQDWLAGQERTARLLLSAAAASSSELPAKQAAGLELAALDPEPVAAPEEKPADAAPGADPAPAPK